MKNKATHIRIILACFFAFGCFPFFANGQSDTTAKTARESFIYIRYYVVNNELPYLRIQTKNKTDNGFEIAPKVPVKVYLNKDSVAEALIGQVTTNNAGEASLNIPFSLASSWDTSGSNIFIARTESSPAFDAKTESITVVNSKLEIDTINVDGRGVVATLSKMENGSWLPMREVDMRLAIKRHGGNLNIGDEETYTTDSLGKVEGSFMKENLPGDATGNLEIVAMVDDNDEVGTLESGKIVPWGTANHPDTNFGYGERSLWSTGREAPFWLLVIALGCIIGVWTVIIYLITGIFKIKKLGKAVTEG